MRKRKSRWLKQLELGDLIELNDGTIKKVLTTYDNWVATVEPLEPGLYWHINAVEIPISKVKRKLSEAERIAVIL